MLRSMDGSSWLKPLLRVFIRRVGAASAAISLAIDANSPRISSELLATKYERPPKKKPAVRITQGGFFYSG